MVWFGARFQNVAPKKEKEKQKASHILYTNVLWREGRDRRMEKVEMSHANYCKIKTV